MLGTLIEVIFLRGEGAGGQDAGLVAVGAIEGEKAAAGGGAPEANIAGTGRKGGRIGGEAKAKGILERLLDFSGNEGLFQVERGIEPVKVHGRKWL